MNWDFLRVLYAILVVMGIILIGYVFVQLLTDNPVFP